MGSCFPKSFSVVTVTGYGSDTVNKAGGKMTRLLFWQDQSSNTFCSFAFAKRDEARASGCTFPDALTERERPSALLPPALGIALISVFHVNLISVDTWSLIEQCVSVLSVALTTVCVCVCTPARFDYWYRERIWHLRKGSAPRLSAPPTPTAIAEIPTHAPAPSDELLTPLQNQNCRSPGTNFCTQRFTCKHMFRCL